MVQELPDFVRLYCFDQLARLRPSSTALARRCDGDAFTGVGECRWVSPSPPPASFVATRPQLPFGIVAVLQGGHSHDDSKS